MQQVNIQTVEALKAGQHYFAAGALAQALGMGPNYGCHFGFKSTVDYARREFKRGYEAAGKGA